MRHFFAIYDGHGGNFVSHYLKDNFHKTLLSCWSTPEEKMVAIKRAYEEADKEICKQLELRSPRDVHEFKDVGATAATVIISRDDVKRVLYTANVGDTRVVLCRNGKAIRLTYDHKVSDEKEAKRISESGGWISGNKMAGFLSVSRAFGDFSLKQWITADPLITETTLHKDDKFLIIACDGLWDVISDQEAVNMVKKMKSAKVMSTKLTEQALAQGSTDNVSIVVVML